MENYTKKIAKKIIEDNADKPIHKIIYLCCEVISQNELARVTGISAGTLISLKYEERQVSKQTLDKLIDSLNLNKKTAKKLMRFVNAKDKKEKEPPRNYAGKTVLNYNPMTYKDYNVDVKLNKKYKIEIYGKDNDKRTAVQVKRGVAFWIDLYKVGFKIDSGYTEFFANNCSQIKVTEVE